MLSMLDERGHAEHLDGIVTLLSNVTQALERTLELDRFHVGALLQMAQRYLTTFVAHMQAASGSR